MRITRPDLPGSNCHRDGFRTFQDGLDISGASENLPSHRFLWDAGRAREILPSRHEFCCPPGVVSQQRTIPARGELPDEVLIVEDERTARRTLGLLLSSCGFHPRAFATAEQALDWLESGAHPAIALVDLDLPGMDGLELIDRMQRLVPLTRPVLVTGTDDQTLSSRLCNRSLPYLRKPLDFNSLLYLLSHPPSPN